MVAAGYGDGTIRVFDTNKAEMVLKVQPHRSSVTAVAYGSSKFLVKVWICRGHCHIWNYVDNV